MQILLLMKVINEAFKIALNTIVMAAGWWGQMVGDEGYPPGGVTPVATGVNRNHLTVKTRQAGEISNSPTVRWHNNIPLKAPSWNDLIKLPPV